jgi:hypothetical protein
MKLKGGVLKRKMLEPALTRFVEYAILLILRRPLKLFRRIKYFRFAVSTHCATL